jgi:hypothetical protein
VLFQRDLLDHHFLGGFSGAFSCATL